MNLDRDPDSNSSQIKFDATFNNLFDLKKKLFLITKVSIYFLFCFQYSHTHTYICMYNKYLKFKNK